MKNQERNVLCDYYNILTENDTTLKSLMLRSKIICRYSFHEKNILEQYQSLIVRQNMKKPKKILNT